MSCAYALSPPDAFSPSEIRQIFQRSPSKASRLWQLAERANGLAAIFQRSPSKASRLWQLAERANGLAATVEERWGELSEERREWLADFAYEAIDPPSDMGSKLQAFLNCCYGAWVILQGEQDAVVAYASAFDRLVDAIILASELDSYKTMTAEEACEWIRETSARAIR
ncbi:MAG: hypothetical protein F6J93_27060 [Oscillatoria sp. SIO1A7]|nr:hypothetical protein [Oscillatoria sp. SIO1A7]